MLQPRFGLLVVTVFVGLGGVSRIARACGPRVPSTAAIALPRTGATEVPTSTSLVILSDVQPADVILSAGDTSVPIDHIEGLGWGLDASSGQHTSFWRVRTHDSMLPASADLALSIAGANGTRTTLTTLKTAAGYDKATGTAANIKAVSFRRVHYRLSDIGAGQCVFAEYHGYLTVEAHPAVIPGTPPESVVSTLTVEPRHGGAAPQSFTFTGPGVYMGGGPMSDGYPGGTLDWMPDFDPTLEYCVTISSFGYGDQSRPPVVSNTACAKVTQQSVAGAGDPADSAMSGAASSGCSMTRSRSPARASLALAAIVLLSVGRRPRHAVARHHLP